MNEALQSGQQIFYYMFSIYMHKVYKHREAYIYQKLSIFLSLFIAFCLAIMQHPTLQITITFEISSHFAFCELQMTLNNRKKLVLDGPNPQLCQSNLSKQVLR